MSDAAKSMFTYVTYIRTTQQKLWEALTDPEQNRSYWFGQSQQTTWKVGSPWRLVSQEGTVYAEGEVVAFDPMALIVVTWRDEHRPEWKADGFSTCRMEIETIDGACKLTVTHSIDVANSKLIGAVSGGWPNVLSNLKSWLETGAPVRASIVKA